MLDRTIVPPRGTGWRVLVGAALCAAAAGIAAWVQTLAPAPCAPADPLRLATFNIEEFPKVERQIAGALALIATLDADAIALDEITDPDALLAAARRVLGVGWPFAHVDTMPRGAAPAPSPPTAYPPMHIGVFYDDARHELASIAIHDDTRLDGRNKPVLEVRLRPRAGGAALQLFVVHLKAGTPGRDIRARQCAALSRLISRTRRPGERAALLGNFNATEPADRDDLRTLAAATGLAWATEDLACSAFWRRDDDCPTSRLDHILTWSPPATVTALGACEQGCELRDRCPLDREEISDHCPVLVTWPAAAPR